MMKLKKLLTAFCFPFNSQKYIKSNQNRKHKIWAFGEVRPVNQKDDKITVSTVQNNQPSLQ